MVVDKTGKIMKDEVMRRSGFTMVELIFVIIIIGILSAAAIPKFGDIKDRAKVNAEYSALSGLDGAITAAMEFYADDNDGDIGVAWHGEAKGTASATVVTNANDNKSVLSKITKKGDDLKITKYISLDKDGTTTAGTTLDAMEYNIVFIEGKASNSTSGVKQDGTTDTNGKPDKNDFWVFNSSPVSIIVNHWSGNANVTTTVESGEIRLIDNDADIIDYNKIPTAAGTVGVTLESGTALTVN